MLLWIKTHSRHRGPRSLNFSGLRFLICKMAAAGPSWEPERVTCVTLSASSRHRKGRQLCAGHPHIQGHVPRGWSSLLVSTPASKSREPPQAPCGVQATSPPGWPLPPALRSHSRASHEDLTERHGSERRLPKQNFNRAARKHSSGRSKARESAVRRASFLRGSSEPLLAANQRGCLRCGVGCFPNTHSWAWPSLRMWHVAAWTRHCPSPARRAATSVSYR